MPDLKQRLDAVDAIPVDDLWPDIRDRFEDEAAGTVTPLRRSDPSRRPEVGWRKALTIAAVFVLLAAAGFVLLRSLTSDSIPADPPVETGPAPVASGALAYSLYGDMYVADPDGSNAVKIADGGADEIDPRCGVSEYSTPHWSPDGKYLAFERRCSESHTAVLLADAHGNVLAEGPTYGWGMTWSPDSTRVAVWKDIGSLGVYGVDGGRQVMPMPPVSGGGNDAAPAWMPDGSALLVWGYAVVPLDGSADYELELGGWATYSPDGTRIAVVGDRSTTIMDADGSPLSEVGGRLFPVWSPDGSRFASSEPGELTIVDVASGAATVLTEATAALDDGDRIFDVQGFSPDGDRILYESGFVAGDRVYFTGLWSIGVDGSDPHVVLSSTTDGSWRPR